MKWQSSSAELQCRTIKLMTKLDSPTVSENLVGLELIGADSKRLKESATIIKSSLIEE